jgi:hypothetical protein
MGDRRGAGASGREVVWRHRCIEKPKVLIIILKWNGWRDTIECLKAEIICKSDL